MIAFVIQCPFSRFNPKNPLKMGDLGTRMELSSLAIPFKVPSCVKGEKGEHFFNWVKRDLRKTDGEGEWRPNKWRPICTECLIIIIAL